MTAKIYLDKRIDYVTQVISKKLSLTDGKDNEANISVACILDEFSYECFKYEASLYQLGTKNWRDLIISNKPKLLLVEAAWEGYNSEWSNKVANLNKFNDKTLFYLTEYCKANKIPTVFWAKEDPYDFNIFIEAAKLFDYVFTTDSDSIPRYRKLLNHNNVFLLPFAAQPKIHNPINKDKDKIGKVAFAGGWYKKFPERSIYMENLLKPAFKYDLAIYNRFANTNHDKYIFPKEYLPYIKNPLEYKKMIKEYKKYELFLNVNSTDSSPTTFSRRVFELLACGIPTISSYSLGIENLFKDIVMLSSSKKDTENHLKNLVYDKEYRDRLSLLGEREVFNKHTYEHRFKTILNSIGAIKDTNLYEGVSVITCTNRKFALDNILSNYLTQKYPLKELLIIINNDNISLEDLTTKLNHHGDIKVFKLPESYSLGKCLNFGIDESQYNYISKFDDDDYYAPDYLTDVMNSFKYTDAHIVGKYSIYAYLEASNTLALRYPDFENRYMDYVAGSTLTIKKEIFQKIKFRDISQSEDTLFLKDSLKKGFKIYASDRFNHAVIRRKDKKTHSWKISDRDFMKKCVFVERTKDYKSIITV